MANIQELSEIIDSYIKTKGDIKADFSVIEMEQNEITMKDGKFTLFRTLFDNEVNIKVIKDHKLGNISLNQCTKESVEQGVDDAITSAEAGTPDEAYDIAPGLDPEKFSMGVLNPDIDKLIERTQELAEDIAARHKKIKLMEMFTKYVHGRSIFMNTNGTRDEKEFGFYVIAIEFAGNDGENSTGIAGTSAVFDNLNSRLIDLADIETELANAENSLNPIKVDGKFEGDVILTPQCAAQLMHFLFSNTVDDSVIINGTSLWLDKVGEQVASPMLTVRFNPWDERIISHEIHTVDGFRSENYDLIEKGVLKCFATKLYTENKCKVKHAPNSGYDMVVEAGDTPYADMIKSVKRGLIVGAVSCGHPGINGEISGVAKNAFYIEDGEIKGAVIETMISGNLMQMFKDIKSISKEQLCNGSMVMPSICIENVTISGN